MSQYFDCYYNSNPSAQWGFGLKQISQWGNARSLPAGQNALHGGQASKRTWRSVVCVSFQQEETQFRACLAWYKLLWNIVTINASWHSARLVPCHTQLAPFPFCFFVFLLLFFKQPCVCHRGCCAKLWTNPWCSPVSAGHLHWMMTESWTVKTVGTLWCDILKSYPPNAPITSGGCVNPNIHNININ